MASSGKLITSAGIVDGTIATADLVADAVTKTTMGTPIASTRSDNTLTLVGTLNFSAAGGLCFLVFHVAILQTVAIGLQQITFRLDGGADVYLHYETAQAINANAARAGEYEINSGVALTGAHTVTIHQATSAGSFAISPFFYLVREYKR